MAGKFCEDSFVASSTATCPDNNCLICTAAQADPRRLSCGHSFCFGCVARYYQAECDRLATSEVRGRCNSSDTVLPALESFPCPVCRLSIKAVSVVGLVGDDAKIPPPSDAVEDMVARITSPKRPNCDICRYKNVETAAKDHCSTCALNFCASCKREHDRHSVAFQQHSAVPVAQRDKSTLRCEQHIAETVRYFCTTCLAPLCAVCAVTDHNQHDTSELTIALGNKKETIEKRIYGMSEKVSKHEELLARLEDLQSIKEAAVKKTKLEIERHVSALTALLHQRKQTLLEELDKYHTASTKSINIERDNSSLALANMKSLWKFAAKLTEPSQTIQLLAMYADLCKMVDGLVNAPEPVLPRDATAMMMFLPKEQLIVGELQTCEISAQLLRRVGDVRAASPTGGACGGLGEDMRMMMSSPVSLTGSYRSLGATSPTLWGSYNKMSSSFYASADSLNIQWQTSPRLVWKADKIGAKTGEINEPYDVAITANGTVVVAEWLNQRLQVFDSTGYSREIIGQNVIQPWGVAITRDGTLAVTDEKERTVKIYSMSGGFVSSWKKLAFGWPRGIVINRAGQFIITDTQHGKHTVSIHLPDGQCIRQFGSQGSGNDQFHWPRYVATDQWDRIIVSDSSNHCVKVLDPTGQFVFKFGSLGGADGLLKHPRGVCVDPNGGIIVADQDNNRVTLFSPDGKIVKHLLSIHKPWGVAISEGGLLAISHKLGVSLYKVFDPMP